MVLVNNVGIARYLMLHNVCFHFRQIYISYYYYLMAFPMHTVYLCFTIALNLIRILKCYFITVATCIINLTFILISQN